MENVIGVSSMFLVCCLGVGFFFNKHTKLHKAKMAHKIWTAMQLNQRGNSDCEWWAVR